MSKGKTREICYCWLERQSYDCRSRLLNRNCLHLQTNTGRITINTPTSDSPTSNLLLVFALVKPNQKTCYAFGANGELNCLLQLRQPWLTAFKEAYTSLSKHLLNTHLIHYLGIIFSPNSILFIMKEEIIIDLFTSCAQNSNMCPTTPILLENTPLSIYSTEQ